MAVTVTKQFKDDFDFWAADRLKCKYFTPQEMEEFKALLRKDMTPGPDQLRQGLTFLTESGVEIPAMIDDHEKRIEMWGKYFAYCAEEIRKSSRRAA